MMFIYFNDIFYAYYSLSLIFQFKPMKQKMIT